MRGVYKSTNKGASWQKINSGLEELPIISLAVDNKGMAIATTNNAVHIVDSSQVTSVGGPKEKLLANFSLYQNYPNPFNPSTTIEYYLPKPIKVKIVIYNILGQQVKLLVDEFQNSGNHKVIFNTSNLSSGVYFYQFIAENYVETKKMILIR
ncbi:MAG: T9SS type A sorting domain-containing protein [Melioribacteraceae bacterium]|nr:T9SS type A sorting domain-containing protein [Melioribacteraceae bacterium]